MSDSYLQPNGTLKNLLGIRDAQELKIAEYQFTATREKQLFAGEVSIPQTFDQPHLKAIHHHIFQDIFEWAGFMRYEPVVLQGEQVQLGPLLHKGSDVFLPAPSIPAAWFKLLNKSPTMAGCKVRMVWSLWQEGPEYWAISITSTLSAKAMDAPSASLCAT